MIDKYHVTYEVKFIRPKPPPSIPQLPYNNNEEEVMSGGDYDEQSYFIYTLIKTKLEGFFQDRSRTKFSFTVERRTDDSKESRE